MKALIIFASFVGNTETMARYIQRALEAQGHSVECKDVIYASLADLAGRELLLLGSPTYEPRMIHDDMLPFYNELESVDLSGYRAAAFGPGDSAWPDFCTAVDMLEQRLKERGAEIAAPALTVDGVVEEAEQRIMDWARGLVK